MACDGEREIPTRLPKSIDGKSGTNDGMIYRLFGTTKTPLKSRIILSEIVP
jgi:hypothetical protein